MTGVTHHRAEAPSRGLLVLAHGAGAGQGHSFMVRMAHGLATRGIDVATFDFPYMAAGRKTPDRLPALLESFRDAVASARGRAELGGHPLFVGGKSMGGRVATHLATESIDGLRGVLALGYPLHPPSRVDKPRVNHLSQIRVPLLIVQGERDNFGTPDELRPALKAVRPAVRIHPVRDGDHSFKVRMSSGQSPEDVHKEILDAIAAWIAKYAKKR